MTYIAALDRLVELEKMAGHDATVKDFEHRRELAQDGLKLLTEPEGYLIRSLDPDGVKHGVFGAAQHGYLETSPNQDAICFRVVDDAQANKIYDKIASDPAGFQGRTRLSFRIIRGMTICMRSRRGCGVMGIG